MYYLNIDILNEQMTNGHLSLNRCCSIQSSVTKSKLARASKKCVPQKPYYAPDGMHIGDFVASLQHPRYTQVLTTFGPCTNRFCLLVSCSQFFSIP